MRAWLLALSMMAAPAAAEVVGADAHSFEIRHRIDTVVPVDRLYAAFGDIGGWWAKEHTYSGDPANLTLTLRPGGCFCERLDKGGGIEHLRVTMVRPGEQIVLTGALGPLLYDAVGGSDGRRVRQARRRVAPDADLSRRGLRQRQGGGDGAARSTRCSAQQVKRLRQFAIAKR